MLISSSGEVPILDQAFYDLCDIYCGEDVPLEKACFFNEPSRMEA